MCGVVRFGWVFVVAVCVGGLVAACGGSGGGAGGVAVRFRGQTISGATVAHWIPIEAFLAHDLYPQQPPPAGEVPDPPRYTACIAFERAAAAASGTGKPAPTNAQLKLACKGRYEEVRTHMLQLLIGYQWMEAETRAHAIKVSEAEVQNAYERAEHIPFRTQAEWQKYLKATGETPADERKLVRFDLEAVDLREKILHERGVPGLRTFYQQYPKELAAETSCSPGYVIPECKQYKGPEPPIS